VIDSHVWLWWAGDPTSMSPKARRAVDKAMAVNAIYVSSISVWEISMLADRGRLTLSMDVADWISRAEAMPFFRFVPVDNIIAHRSVRLPGVLHQDPADRIIVATALTLGMPLVTKDEKLREYSHLSTIW
jgi:PIN domain nuclease of toxin-antitoxin system